MDTKLFLLVKRIEYASLMSLLFLPHILRAVKETEIEALSELFTNLSSSIDDDGLVGKEEFQLGLFRNSKKQSLFRDRVFQLFDLKYDGVMDFGEFVRTMSIFHPRAPQAQKVRWMKLFCAKSCKNCIKSLLSDMAVAFQLYDIWQTGFIEREEVKEMILALLKESDLVLSDDIIKVIIDKTFEDADSKGDGKIDLEEWKDFVARKKSLLNNMTIPYLM